MTILLTNNLQSIKYHSILRREREREKESEKDSERECLIKDSVENNHSSMTHKEDPLSIECKSFTAKSMTFRDIKKWCLKKPF